MDYPSEVTTTWPYSMVGTKVLHLETGVFGTVVKIVNDPRLNELSVQLDNNHILLARNAAVWVKLTADSEAIITTFSRLINEAVQFTAQQAAIKAPELQDQFSTVLALVLNLHAMRLGERS